MCGFYERRILPPLIAWAMRDRDLAIRRARLIPRAAGRVLEVGIGSGPNLPLYGPRVTAVVGIDPSAALLHRAAARRASARMPVQLVRGSADALPLPDAGVDTVVTTWTLCSVPDARRALAEMRRVLAPDGELLFVEHGLAPDAGVARCQRSLDPLWQRVSCRLSLPVDALVGEAGFRITELDAGYLGKGPKPLTYLYEGRACRA